MRTHYRFCLAILLAILLLALSAGAFQAGSLRLVYRDVTGGQAGLREYVICQGAQGVSLVATEENITRTVEAGPDFGTLREGYEDKSGGRLTLVREGRSMRLTGALGRRQVSRVFEVDDAVWYGSILFLRDFVLSGQPEMEFYMTKPEEDRVIKLLAIREANEEIMVDGEPVAAVRVRFTLPDIRRLLWSSTYWFRASDGLFVKSLETRGPPGTAKSAVELLEEGAS